MNCNRGCLDYKGSLKRAEYIPVNSFKERMKLMKLYEKDLRNNKVRITNYISAIYIEFR